MATTTNYSWTTPDDTALVKDGAAAIRSLGTAIDTTVFNNASAAIAKTIVDAKGDIIAATAADTVARLAVGANDTILTADSTTATGLKWAAPAASGGMTLISETVASSASAIDFTSIPQTYKQLMLVWHGITHSAPGSDFALRLNASSSANYIDTGIRLKAGVASQDQTARSRLGISAFGVNSNNTGQIYQGSGVLLIDNYASSTKTKTYQHNYYFFDNVNAENNNFSYVGKFNDTTAITQINVVRLSGTDTISNVANSTIRLYGIS